MLDSNMLNGNDAYQVLKREIFVQGYLDKLKNNDKNEYERFVSEVNEILNPIANERGITHQFIRCVCPTVCWLDIFSAHYW